MGWVKASALRVGDCNFTHDVTHVPLPPLFSTTPLRHIASPYVFCLPAYAYLFYTIYGKSSVLSFSLFILLTWPLCFLLSSPRFLLYQFNRQHSARLLSLRLRFLTPVFLHGTAIIPVVTDWLEFSVEFDDIDRLADITKRFGDARN